MRDRDADRIKLAVERLSESGELIADCSRPYTLPTICGKHKDLKSITTQILTDLFGGEYNQFHTSFTIIDCRYPYEYNGGHIQGAVLNSQNYPRLYYPEVYILHGGYKTFYEHNQLTDLFGGEYNQFHTSFTIIDCRYPYEYNGGHIQGAVNIYTKQSIDVLLQRSEKNRPQILIFHCEFSSQRAPTLLRYLRSQDRVLNSQNYPRLYYPEVYILHGGYKTFYEHNQDLCHPSSYVPMLHEDYRSELHHIRTVTKSQTEREKTRGKSKTMSRVVRF
ncbi:M-phase inducer phosphatase 1-A-like [Patella vulgata]|uniref:M-phase inducer phosphatase 1-A-like n=1 Tax=Patella vulgata TaxID=6465 RepID=UPI0024AA02FE|nr:M-phase inducer phosphatase 1-A-like [Patella vulgata]